MRRLKQLEAENARLKKLVAERDLEIEVMKEITAKNGERAGSPCRSGRRDGQGPVATAGLHAARCWAIRAALLLSQACEGHTVADTDGGAFGAVSALWLSEDTIFLGRDGHAMSFGRAYRLWRRARLQVPRKRPRKRIATGRPRPNAPGGANQVWSYDFVFNWCANGQQLKCLTVTDEWTKEGLAIEVDGRILRPRDRGVVAARIGAGCAALSALGRPEFVSRALLKWIVDQGIATALIDPGKPWQNGATESFNGKFRDECLSLEWFRSRSEAKVLIEVWRKHFNTVRPHSSLGYLTPAAFAAGIKTQGAANLHATGRIAAACGASAPRPVASPSRKGQKMIVG